MAQLHRAVIDALKVTFSDQKFEQYLRDQAADTEQIVARRAERDNLLQTIPKLAAAEAKLAKAIAVSDDMDALVAELKTTQQERRQAEARVADLEGYERDLRDQQEQVERLRRVWGGWAAALDADEPTARQILKKILVGRIYVRPVRPGAWRFAGISRYDGALRGGLGRTGPADIQPGYGPRYDDFCRLMLHLLAEPAEARDPSQRESLFGLCTQRRPAPAIAGGSDAQGGEQTGWVSSGPPARPQEPLAVSRGATAAPGRPEPMGVWGPYRGPQPDQKNALARRRIPCFHGTRCDTPEACWKRARLARYHSKLRSSASRFE